MILRPTHHFAKIACWATNALVSEWYTRASDISGFVNIARDIKHVNTNIIIIIITKFCNCCGKYLTL